MIVGVLALQGGFAQVEHALSLFPKIIPRQVRSADDLAQCAALVLPGGESTVMNSILARGAQGLREALPRFVASHPTLGICAGLIVCAQLRMLDVEVIRNHFGRQSKSRLRSLKLAADAPSAGASELFVRAPGIASHGPLVEPLAWDVDTGVLVSCRWKHVMGVAFHPELSPHLAWLSYFLQMVAGHSTVSLSPSLLTLRAPWSIDVEVARKRAFAVFQCGGVIMDVTNVEQARLAEAAGAVAVMALERIPADIKADGGIALLGPWHDRGHY